MQLRTVLQHLLLFVYVLVDVVSSHWAVRLHPSTQYTYEQAAEALGQEFALESLGQVGRLENTYLFRPLPNNERRNALDEDKLQAAVLSHVSVQAVLPQREFARYRRDGLSSMRSKSASDNSRNIQRRFDGFGGGGGLYNVAKSEDDKIFNDPSFGDQWYMGTDLKSSLNVRSVWAKNYTGRNIVVSVLDDGIEYTHPDLQANYDPLASLDLNGKDADPFPDISKPINSHGTRCAGEIAAIGNNSICGVGIAFNAKVGAVRMLDGMVTDADEATAFSVGPKRVHIYTASWGPQDDGMTVEGPGPLASDALVEGIIKGRNGKGALYVFAGGNGGPDDNCNCDGYVNSPYTISIGAALRDESSPWFSEPCSAQLAVTWSADVDRDPVGIWTADIHGGCTDAHGGTSAAAPMATGVLALVLEANPNITWRDAQYLIAATSRVINAKDSSWTTNGVGRYFSNTYGYGVMDADALVNAALNWTTLPPPLQYQIRGGNSSALTISEQAPLLRSVNVKNNSTKIRYVEQVQVFLNITSQFRGDLKIALISPMGTRSELLSSRPYDDDNKQGFPDWGMTSVQFFGEHAVGVWTLQLEDTQKNGKTSVLHGWRLLLRGTNKACAHDLCKVTAVGHDATNATVNGRQPDASAMQIQMPTESSASSATDTITDAHSSSDWTHPSPWNIYVSIVVLFFTLA